MARPRKEVATDAAQDVIEAVDSKVTVKKSGFTMDEIILARKIFGEEFRDLLDADPADRNLLIQEAIADAQMARDQREIQKNIFAVLSAIDVTPYIKKMKEGDKELSYLPWAAADKLVKQIYPLMEKRVIMFPDKEGTLHPYRYDRVTGNFTVHTEITIEGLTIGEDLVVMDNNIPVRAHSYTVLTRWGEYTIPPINDNMINKTKRRCFVKNLAQFGLGIDVFFSDTVEDAEEEEVSNVPDPVIVPESYAKPAEKPRPEKEPEPEKAKEPAETEKPAEPMKNETKAPAEQEPATAERPAAEQPKPEQSVTERSVTEQSKTDKPKAEKPEAKPAPVKSEQPKEMTVEDALEHVFANGGEALKGHKVRDLIIGTKDAKKSTNILRSFANCGVGADKTATKTVLEAIERGDLKFVLASEQENDNKANA